MISYTERYQRGEYETVWRELIACGSTIYDSALYADAQAVAVLMMHRACANIALLYERLQKLQYRFIFPNVVWEAPTPELHQTLQDVEQTYGPLPLVLKTWFREVGQVCFIGSHPALSYYAAPLGGTDQDGPTSDPLMVGYGGVEEEEEGIDLEGNMYSQVPAGPMLVLALDASHKANTSGGGSTGMLLPAPGFDAPLTAASTWDTTYFIPYLRTCFQWGGFPGLAHQPTLSPHTRELLAFLTMDLQPI